ncbi:MAG: class I SAM-dependent methyltransferase [Anaerolineales bacterium]|nr:class I SAM-dependent methyltransferase [Anaerolineales bacterium]
MANTTTLRAKGSWREQLVRDLTGDVLEIGVGSGANLPLYRAAAGVWAIEPDATLAAKAESRRGETSVPIVVKVGAAESLPFEDARFDHVVSSLVFCSVADPERALGEIRRVLKPDGALHMVEHIRPTTSAVAAVFSAVTPIWSRVAHNCHLDRPTIDLLRGHGWTVHLHRRRTVFVHVTAIPPAP